MNNRISKETLSAKIRFLNSLAPDTERRPFRLNYAYGGVRLERIINTEGGAESMSERVTKGEMARILDTLTNTLYMIKYM